MKGVFAISILTLSILLSCSKVEGPGGISTIQGTVTKQNFSQGSNEIIDLTIFGYGTGLEHGEYMLLNTPAGETNYYIYFKFDTSPGDGDPGLSGRTGIQVIFDTSDDNVGVATKIKDAIEATAFNELSVAQDNDILHIACVNEGYVVDSDNGTTPFDFDIQQNGQDEVTGSSQIADDEKVYIIYGANSVYSDATRTGGDGVYQFTNLNPGDYTVYCVSEDPTTGEATTESVSVNIAKGSDVTTAGDIAIIY